MNLPATIKYILFTIFILIINLKISYSQTFENLSFGEAHTLDIITWNIEHFPKNNNTTIDYLSKIITALKPDVIALQEIEDTSSLKVLVSKLSGYKAYFNSARFAGLAYLYNTNVVQVNKTYEIYASAQYFSPLPKAPLVIDFIFNNENYLIINNHLKCCGDGFLDLNNSNDEENRRLNGLNLIKYYIDNNLKDKKVFIVGDFNDEILDSEENNVFKSFTNDSENYLISDVNIALKSSANWSYPSWPSHLDHIIITNELFNLYNQTNTVIDAIKIDEHFSGGWYMYDTNVSDHRPVAIKLAVSPVSLVPKISKGFKLNQYPNPFDKYINIDFSEIENPLEITIFDAQGREVFSSNLYKTQNKIAINTEMFDAGLYLLKLTDSNKNVYTSKIAKYN